MGNLQYYLMRSNINDSFYGRIISSNSVDRDEFLKILNLLHPALDAKQSSSYLEALFSTIDYLLADGKSINIPGLLKISTVMRGSFKSLDDNFNSKTNSIGINFIPDKRFIKRLRKKITVEKVERPQITPIVRMIKGGSNGDNSLSLEEANRFLGNNLILKGHSLSALELTAYKGESRKLLVRLEELVICRHSDKELILTFHRSFTPPGWLKEGTALSVKLIYLEDKGNIHLESPPLDTVWRVRGG